MNELRARVISQEKGIYKIQSGTAVKRAGTDSIATREIGNGHLKICIAFQ